MKTNYEWTIAAMNCKVKEKTLENIVSVVHWYLNASNENFNVETYGATAMPEPSETDFTLYEDLTKEQVVSWIVDALSVVPESIDGVAQQSKLDKIKENLSRELFLKENPIEINLPLPFNN